MSKLPITAGILLAVVILGAYFAWLFLRGKTEYVSGQTVLRVGEVEYVVDIADTPALQAQGLSGRENLGIDKGMLFIFPKKTRTSFWMKGMHFPLDMIWIADGKVVGFEENAPPLEGGSLPATYRPKQKIDWVLEVNAGQVAEKMISVGDGVTLIKR